MKVNEILLKCEIFIESLALFFLYETIKSLQHYELHKFNGSKN